MPIWQAPHQSRYCPTTSGDEQKSYARSMKINSQGFGVAATGGSDSEAPAERSNTLAPCSAGADAQNSGVSGEGAQDITDHYPNPKGA